jgi:cardiolipin synthase A/B
VDLIVQPGDGITPILKALDGATEQIDITIFRLDLPQVLAALGRAVGRGVTVRALVAHTNSKGEKGLRKVESKLLDAGVVVSRTDDDLPRYHGKLLTVDRDTLYLFGFNYTKLDIRKSRSFGLVVDDDEVVREAIRLFDGDLLKQDYTPQHPSFVVSPDNARERLSAFIEEAERELLIYDGRLSDKAMIRLLEARAKAGVDVRVLGRPAKHARLRAEKVPRHRRTSGRSSATASGRSSAARAFASWN